MFDNPAAVLFTDVPVMSSRRRRPVQKSLSPVAAWQRIELAISGQSASKKLRVTSVAEAVAVLRDSRALGKRRRYRDFLFDVLRRCGPVYVGLCAIGLGQAQVANMNTADRSILVHTMERKKTGGSIQDLEILVPDSLKDLHAEVQRPPETGPHGSRFKIAKLEHVANFFPPGLRKALDQSMLRTWEMSQGPQLLGTEGIRTEIAWTGSQDGIMLLDIGFAQEIAAELFPPQTRPAVPSCFGTYTLRGALPTAITSLFGEGVSLAIEESELRIWEKGNGQLGTTDCVEMLLREEDSRHGMLRLRLGWERCVGIVQLLYG